MLQTRSLFLTCRFTCGTPSVSIVLIQTSPSGSIQCETMITRSGETLSVIRVMVATDSSKTADQAVR
jgi:hypothetical protein